jgi:hypothetical protein
MVAVYKKGMDEYKSNEKVQTEKLTSWAKRYNYLEMAKNYMNLYRRI